MKKLGDIWNDNHFEQNLSLVVPTNTKVYKDLGGCIHYSVVKTCTAPPNSPRLKSNEISNSEEVTFTERFQELETIEKFISKVKANNISSNEAKVFIRNHPTCLFVTDDFEVSAVEYAQRNKNLTLTVMLMERKFALTKLNAESTERALG